MHYPKGCDLILPTGHLKEINNEEILHSVTTFKDSSASTIILLSRDYKIIVIHRAFHNKLNLIVEVQKNNFRRN